MKKSHLLAACAVACISGFAIATIDPHPVTSPGWMYGRGKCAPWSTPPVTSREACMNCCQNAVDTWLLPPNQLANCQEFCNVYWNANG
ncbi:MAG TPA: hypothetical protein VK176_10290 [Phycisphaerales bacterium]|nr:hypothetical protein [Phycisphaerales bacterium]